MLLSRAETADLGAMSAELGRVVSAACLLPSWVEASLRPSVDDKYRHEPLRPDVHKVDNKVRYAVCAVCRMVEFTSLKTILAYLCIRCSDATTTASPAPLASPTSTS